MSKDQLDKLLELIDVKIAEFDARNSSDGGLMVSIRRQEIEKELYDLIPESR